MDGLVEEGEYTVQRKLLQDRLVSLVPLMPYPSSAPAGLVLRVFAESALLANPPAIAGPKFDQSRYDARY